MKVVVIYSGFALTLIEIDRKCDTMKRDGDEKKKKSIQ